jgi:hypothetical protein
VFPEGVTHASEMATLDTSDLTAPPPEIVQVIDWRYAELVRAGYEPAQAERLAVASEVDLHAAVGLLDRGCPPALAERILL